jgi:hypothetical protein
MSSENSSGGGGDANRQISRVRDAKRDTGREEGMKQTGREART